jgi:uncharacterized membrane protein YgdD (TMEM256/DUF423 family)
MPSLPLTARFFIALGAVLAAGSVALSAAAAHVPALQQAGPAFAASLEQHQFHALGLVLVGLALARHTSRWLVASGALMVAGLLLFCLNINARILWNWDAARALVPFGGSAFILAWLALALGVLWPGQRPGFTPEAPANAR